MDNELPMPTEDNPVVVWEGDCLALLPRLPAGCVDAVVTDPPYPNEFDYVWDHLAQTYRCVREGGFLVSLCGHYQLPRVIDAIRSTGWKWFWPCVVSNNCEPIMHGYKVKVANKICVTFTKGKAVPTRYFCDDLGLGTRNTDWLDAQNEHEWGQGVRPFRNASNVFCPESGIILDPFAGSGTTGVAAILEGRKCILIEKEPKYAAICRRRVAEAMGRGPNQLPFDKPADLFAVA